MMALGVVDMLDTKHGLIGELTNPAEFRRVTGKKELYKVMDKSLLYDYDKKDHDEMLLEEIKTTKARHLELLTMWHVQKGTLLDMGQQIRKPLDKRFYKWLAKKIIGYKHVTIRQYFDHSDDKWCPLETHVIKELKAHTLRGWTRLEEKKDSGEFAKRFSDDEACLNVDRIKISSGALGKVLDAMECFNYGAGGTAKKQGPKARMPPILRARVDCKGGGDGGDQGGSRNYPEARVQGGEHPNQLSAGTGQTKNPVFSWCR